MSAAVADEGRAGLRTDLGTEQRKGHDNVNENSLRGEGGRQSLNGRNTCKNETLRRADSFQELCYKGKEMSGTVAAQESQVKNELLRQEKYEHVCRLMRRRRENYDSHVSQVRGEKIQYQSEMAFHTIFQTQF